MSYEDTARFYSDDADELVTAAFACPYCLGHPQQLVLVTGSHSSVVSCACAPCDQRYNIGLDGAQTLRLALAPPRALWLQRSAGTIRSQATP
jgi:hypothetical protein